MLHQFLRVQASPSALAPEQFDGTILFLEDYNTPTINVWHDLQVLRLAGVFDRISGLLIGPTEGVKRMADSAPKSLREVVLDVVGNRDIPILGNVNCGHAGPNLPLPPRDPRRGGRGRSDDRPRGGGRRVAARRNAHMGLRESGMGSRDGSALSETGDIRCLFHPRRDRPSSRSSTDSRSTPRESLPIPIGVTGGTGVSAVPRPNVSLTWPAKPPHAKHQPSPTPYHDMPHSRCAPSPAASWRPGHRRVRR